MKGIEKIINKINTLLVFIVKITNNIFSKIVPAPTKIWFKKITTQIQENHKSTKKTSKQIEQLKKILDKIEIILKKIVNGISVVIDKIQTKFCCITLLFYRTSIVSKQKYVFLFF